MNSFSNAINSVLKALMNALNFRQQSKCNYIYFKERKQDMVINSLLTIRKQTVGYIHRA